MAVGWGIIGAGNHANLIMAPAIKRAQSAPIVAVCSRDAARAEVFAREHGVARAYTSYEELLRDPEVSVVYVATPNALHAEQACQAAQAGKHVLCEKPMALTVADAEGMLRACESAGVKLGVTLQNRFHPAHQEMRRRIRQGEAGELLLLLGEYSRALLRPVSAWKTDPSLAGGGAVMGLATHVLDLFRFLTGQEVEEVRAQADSPGWGQPVDDLVLAALKFSGRLRASMVSGYYVPRALNSVVVYGTRARLVGLGTVGMDLRGSLLVEGEEGSIRQEFADEDAALGNYVRMVQQFVRAVEEGTGPEASGEDGLELVRIVDAVRESARTGRAVSLRR
ncbi:MAG: Gfo/Idh/MocA family oxidoreductase [Chloroflexi bacterium]|nr:Gfo/Idh/MocA family oxidoreductase [Chloroflexota bacterium]